jgi:Skp family chaperone for outer membrane proteins
MMQQIHRRWMVGVAAVAVSIGLGTYMSARATALAPLPPAAPKIATVELEPLIQKLKEREDREKFLDAEARRVDEQVKGLKADLNAQKTKIENEPDGPGKISMAKEFGEKVDRAEFEAKFSGEKLVRLRGEAFADLFKRIEEGCRAVAKDNGYDLVLTSDEKGVIQPNPETVMRNISLRRILYVNSNLDITQQVADYLNNQYAAGPEVGAGPGGKP